MKNINFLKPLAVTIFMMVCTLSSNAQNSLPYSVYGIGSLYSNSNQIQMAIGGVSVPYSSPYFINSGNPASYMAFDSLSFVFNGSFYLRSGTLSSASLKQKTTDASLADLSLGFPVFKFWRTAFGLVPFSKVSYEIHDEIINQPNIAGRIVNIYKGSGGLNKVFWGNAVGYKNLSVGVNMQYLFGNIEKENQATFPDSVYFFNIGDKRTTYAHGITLDMGLLYKIDLKKNNFLNIGLTFSPKQNISANTDRIIYRFKKDYAKGVDIVADTINFKEGESGKIVIPMAVGFGLSYGEKNRWMAAADVKWQQWSNYKYLGVNGGLNDNVRVSLGGEFRPMKGTIGKYWERIYYRAGFRFEKTYLTINNKPINDIAFSFGFGLPTIKSNSTFNLGFEAGTYGNAGEGSIRDNYFKISIGGSLQELWFLKQRYF